MNNSTLLRGRSTETWRRYK